MGDDTDIAELIADPQLEDELDGEADDESDEPDAAEEDKLSSSLRPAEGELDDAVGQLLIDALNERQGGSLSLFKRVLQVPGERSLDMDVDVPEC